MKYIQDNENYEEAKHWKKIAKLKRENMNTPSQKSSENIRRAIIESYQTQSNIPTHTHTFQLQPTKWCMLSLSFMMANKAERNL